MTATAAVAPSVRSGEWHRARFAEFVRAKALVGEPSPHMTVVGWLAQHEPPEERLWRAGCYLVPYSVLTGEAIWREWPLLRAVRNPTGLDAWIRANWPGMHTRLERRCVRTPEQFSRSLLGFSNWLLNDVPALYASSPSDPLARYERWWESAMSIPFFGRYITIRLLEYMRRYADSRTELQDIRSIGGWSPIKALVLLRPDAKAELMTGEQQPVDRVAREVLSEYRRGGLDVGFYVFAALLCEYRVAWENRKQYAGWTIDQELEYDRGPHGTYWRERGYATRLFEARDALFPRESLGEHMGWDGRRYDVAALLRDHGIVWSDKRWNYQASRHSLSQPVPWEASVA